MEIPTKFQNYFKQNNFEKMTTIQETVFEPFINGEDFVAMAPTGSGKTLAFAMPILQNITPNDGLQVVILEPSQELAVQVRNVIAPLAKEFGCKVQSITGGANPKRQLDKLKEKPEIIVATLGRLDDLVKAKKIKLATVQTVVVDEADEMLNSTKLQSVRELLSDMPEDIQLTFFSATANDIFNDMKKWFGVDFNVIDQRSDESYTTGIKHYFINTTDDGMKDMLIRQMAHNRKFLGMVFFNNSRSLHKVISSLDHNKTNFVALDSKMSSQSRKEALQLFTSKKVNLMLTTDVAARGMDINNVTNVVNYMVPRDKNEYTHRAGRTGRMGKEGSVVTFGNTHDYRNLKSYTDSEIEKVFLNADGSFSDKETYNKKRKKRAETSKGDKPKAKKRLRDQKNKGKRRKPSTESK
ncbi:DEAD/DEAH box helicase [Lactobacillus terrae]|uniref:DEAD/DEAH box helicase n=1 Tax=Lactobacillus terrae TaxID=2269374 RepID=UPI001FEB47B8|nr:DEAD/DEAH box helicase [Lactobacillus terrae]